METMQSNNEDPKKVDVPAKQDLNEQQKELLDIANLINSLEDDLRKERDLSRAAAIKKIIDEQKKKKEAILAKTFDIAQPETQTTDFKDSDFDDAFNANGGARLHKRIDDARDRGIM